MLEFLSYEELENINGGSVKDVFCTAVGVCGGVVGGAAGFVGGFLAVTATSLGLEAPAGIVVGVFTGAAGAALGYAGSKSAAEDAWDYVAEALS